jgi:hypothetical protein
MRTLLFISIVGLLAGCTQGEGEACQNPRDCDDGLVCTLEDDNRGFCQDPDDVEMTDPEIDASEPPLDPDDAAMDAGHDASLDAGLDASFDAGPDDDAG